MACCCHHAAGAQSRHHRRVDHHSVVILLTLAITWTGIEDIRRHPARPGLHHLARQWYRIWVFDPARAATRGLGIAFDIASRPQLRNGFIAHTCCW
jgi:hypothetical protein